MYWLFTLIVTPVMTYATLFWKPKMKKAPSVNRVGRMQRLACLGIACEQCITTPTAAFETHVDLPPFPLVVVEEVNSS